LCDHPPVSLHVCRRRPSLLRGRGPPPSCALLASCSVIGALHRLCLGMGCTADRGQKPDQPGERRRWGCPQALCCTTVPGSGERIGCDQSASERLCNPLDASIERRGSWYVMKKAHDSLAPVSHTGEHARTAATLYAASDEWRPARPRRRLAIDAAEPARIKKGSERMEQHERPASHVVLQRGAPGCGCCWPPCWAFLPSPEGIRR
jgi:hypothetical protein